jgi:hypothetical protein
MDVGTSRLFSGSSSGATLFFASGQQISCGGQHKSLTKHAPPGYYLRPQSNPEDGNDKRKGKHVKLVEIVTVDVKITAGQNLSPITITVTITGI